jgi:uncharacterized protein YbjT (DUF2867 family)
MSKILVVGANGTVGTGLVKLLSERGQQVARATSRATGEAGDVHLNVVDRSGLATAFDGIEKAFLLAPPGYTNQDELLSPVIDQATSKGVRKIVLMTAMGANADEAAPMRKVERHLERSGLVYAIIRPNWFMQNFNTFWLNGIVNQGKIMLPTGNGKGSFIDARDISAVAAELLVGGKGDGQEFDLTGSDVLDHDEVAAILSRVTGRTIVYEDITPEAMLAGLIGAGLPKAYSEFLVMILGYFKAGYSARTTDAVATITGKAPRRFEQYATDYRSAWVG